MRYDAAVFSVAELNARTDLFTDPGRPPAENAGPFVIVVDHFYSDPFAVRDLALRLPYKQYAPPLQDMVAPDVYARIQSKGVTGTWRSSALYSFQGRPVTSPWSGFRHNPDWLRQRMERLTRSTIDPAEWEPGGDWWNGAFHLRDGEHRSGTIHHHYYPSNIDTYGWSGVVYLTPDAPPAMGTSVWRRRSSGLCIARRGEVFDYDTDAYERVFLCENVFNRLLLFREHVLHFAEPGFGQNTDDSRLVQTFFFTSTPSS